MKKLALVIVILILVVLGVVVFRKQGSVGTLNGSDLETSIGEGQPLSDDQIQEIVQLVGKHIKLPEEKPNVGVITDIETLLSTQPFYQGAKDGDVLLIYPGISKAILYNLTEDVIINVGPVVFENPEGGPADSE